MFSLRDTASIEDDGVSFRSIYDGSKHLFTPERAISEQQMLGADFIMCFDDALRGRPRWTGFKTLWRGRPDGRRAASAPTSWPAGRDVDGPQMLLGIVQGGVHPPCAAGVSSNCWRSVFPDTPSAGLQ